MEENNDRKLMIVLTNGQYLIGFTDGQIMWDPRVIVMNPKGINLGHFLGNPKTVTLGDFMVAYPIDEQSDIGKAYSSEVSGIKIVNQLPKGILKGMN